MIRRNTIAALCGLGLLLLGGIWAGPSRASVSPPPGRIVPATPAITPLPGCRPGWGYAADYPSAVSQAAVVGLDAFVYSFGSGAYKYSVDSNTWTAISPPPSGVLQGASAITDSQYIYLLNGYSGGQVARLQRYDPATDSWTTLPVPPNATADQAAVYLNGKIYRIAGGTASVDVYTISTATWAPTGTVAAYPQTLSDLLAVADGGYIYAGGGGGNTIASMTTKTYRYDPAANTWDDAAVSDFRQVHYAGATGILNGRWVVAGGYDVDYQIDKNVEALALSQPTGSWTGLPWQPRWRFLTSGTTVAGVFYLIGGFSVGTSPHREVQYYTDGPCYGTPVPPTPTVTPTASSTPPPCGASEWSTDVSSYPIPVAGAAVANYQGIIYSFGGYANDAGVANSYNYRPANNVWTALPPLPEARFFASAVSDGTYLYILNGADVTAVQSQASLYRYTPADGTYTTLAVPPAATDSQAIVLLNGKIYRIAGHYSHYGPTTDEVGRAAMGKQPTNEFPVNTVDVYTISTNTWAPAGTIANYPLAVGNLSAVAYNGYIYTVGGGSAGNVISNKTYRYDPAANTWDDAAVADLPTPVRGSAVDLFNGRWIIAGGNSGTGGPSSSVFTLNLANPTSWATLSPLPIAEDYTSGARSGNNFYVVGGITVSATGATRVVQRYTDAPACPASPTATPTYTPTVGNTATATATSPAVGTATTVPPSSTATGGPTTMTTTPAPPPTGTTLPSTATPGPPSSTATSGPNATGTAVNTATPCLIRFTDVTDPTAYYYQGVYYLACHGVISGYSDGMFKPFNQTTRGQMTKIVTLAFNLPLATPPTGGTFADVDSSNSFYGVIETAAAQGIVSGYTCGGSNPQTGASEPCDSAHRPYFRPSNSVTRGQLTKIVVRGAGWSLITPPNPTFRDVAHDNVFYGFIETAVCHGIISGYNDQTFRPSSYAFRGQIAKIVYLAVTNPAGTCAP